MILNWLGNLILGRREKVSVVLSLEPKTVSGMETLVERYNEWQNPVDAITMDDVAEVAIQNFLRKAMRVNWEEYDIGHVVEKPPVPVLQSNVRIRTNERQGKIEVVRGIKQG